ncbi:MAG: hypothetical protein ACYDAK_08250 [Candidatus Limnocylindrales bacterium]
MVVLLALGAMSVVPMGFVGVGSLALAIATIRIPELAPGFMPSTPGM